MKLLSICIPTYNRVEFLRDCLESVIASCKGYEDLVEIVVSDNCSQDDTKVYMSEFLKRNSNTKYFENEKNIGAEANFFIAAERSTGRYCLILGDDDKVCISAIPSILKVLDDNSNLSIIVLNFSQYDKYFDEILNVQYHRVGRSRFYSNRDEIMLDFGPSLSFISSVVFERIALKLINLEKYDYFKSYGFSFLYMVYDLLSKRESCFYINEPLILQRGHNSTVDIIRYFFDGLPQVFDSLRSCGYSEKALFVSKKRIFTDYIIWFLLDYRLSKEKISQETRRKAYSLASSFKNKVITFFVLHLPLSILIFIRFLKRLIN